MSRIQKAQSPEVIEHLIRNLCKETGATEEQAREAIRKALRTQPLNFFEFCQRAYPGFEVSRTGFQYHLTMKLEEFFRKVERKESPRLIISMPPRHGKSFTASTYFPAYCFGRNPNIQIIHSSYSADLSNDFSGRIRSVMQEREYAECFPNTLLETARANLQKWGIANAKGTFFSVGVGGPITGRGANLLIIDDPVKNAEEADSAVYRNKQRDWFSSTAYTRLEKGAGVLLIMTRWHVEDVGGYVLHGYGDEPPAEEWEQFILPAVAKDNDPLGREPGEPLWPEKYDQEALERIHRQLPERWWQALYQQSPVIPGGNLLNVDKIIHGIPNVPVKVYQGWDLAISGKQSADYTVCVTIGLDSDSNMYIMDVVRGHWGFNETLRQIEAQASKWKPVQIGIETIAYQMAAFEEANRRWVLPIKEIRPDKDKVTRAKLFETRIDAGKVFANKSAPWWRDLSDEMVSFPRGAHDDQVDAIVTAMLLTNTIKWYEDPDLRELLNKRSKGEIDRFFEKPEEEKSETDISTEEINKIITVVGAMNK